MIIKHGKVIVTEKDIMIVGFTFKGCDMIKAGKEAIRWAKKRLRKN